MKPLQDPTTRTTKDNFNGADVKIQYIPQHPVHGSSLNSFSFPPFLIRWEHMAEKILAKSKAMKYIALAKSEDISHRNFSLKGFE